MKSLFFLFICSIFCFAACDDDLPEPTQNGANTFGCLVNGEPWTPEVDGFNEVAIDALFYLNSDGSAGLSILGIKDVNSEDRQSLRLDFFSEYFEVDSKYPLTDGIEWRDDQLSGNCIRIEIDTSLHNEIHITHLDSVDKTISGTFNLTYREDECDKAIEITEGRFDVTYRQ